jgi:hypothetical protein
LFIGEWKWKRWCWRGNLGEPKDCSRMPFI